MTQSTLRASALGTCLWCKELTKALHLAASWMEGTLRVWKGFGCKQVSVSACKEWILPKICVSCCCSGTLAHWVCCFAFQRHPIALPLQRACGLNSLHLTWHIYLRHPVSPSVVVDPIYKQWKCILSFQGLFKTHVQSSKPTVLVLIPWLAAKPASRETCERRQREPCAQQCCCTVLCSWSCHAWSLHVAGRTGNK